MKVFFSLWLVFGLWTVGATQNSRDVVSQITVAIKTVANGKKLSSIQTQKLDRLFGGRSQSTKFIEQIRQFWIGKTKKRLTGVKLLEDARLIPPTWIDVRYRIGTVDTGTEYTQQLYLERTNGLWQVVRFTKIGIAPIASLAPASPPG